MEERRRAGQNLYLHLNPGIHKGRKTSVAKITPALQTDPSLTAPPEARPQPLTYKTPLPHTARRSPWSSPSAEPAKHAVETLQSSAPVPHGYRASQSTALAQPEADLADESSQ